MLKHGQTYFKNLAIRLLIAALCVVHLSHCQQQQNIFFFVEIGIDSKEFVKRNVLL